MAILSDMVITDEEHDFLEALMDRWGLAGQDRRKVRDLNIDDDPAKMVRELKSVDSSEVLVSELIQAIAVDGQVAKPERDMLEKVAQTLGFDPGQLELMLGAVGEQ